jgi:hypothetical protein
VSPRSSARGLWEPGLGTAEATERWVRPACISVATGRQPTKSCSAQYTSIVSRATGSYLALRQEKV